MTEPQPQECLNYLLEIKTKDPIDEDCDRIVKRKINLAVWGTLDKVLPKNVCCSVYSVLPTKSSAAGEAGVLDELPHMTSTDLLLIAHDEWKRREERKHNHEESGWIAGWINGFMTSKKWVYEHLGKLRQQQKGEP